MSLQLADEFATGMSYLATWKVSVTLQLADKLFPQLPKDVSSTVSG